MTAGQKPQDGSEADWDWVPMTIRLPRQMHQRLRNEAFFGNTTMSAIVREGIEDRLDRTPAVSANQATGPGSA